MLHSLCFYMSPVQLALPCVYGMPSLLTCVCPLCMCTGGVLAGAQQGGPLGLRLLLDGSCMEAFTTTGHTLTTRAHRGQPAVHAHTDARADVHAGARLQSCTSASTGACSAGADGLTARICRRKTGRGGRDADADDGTDIEPGMLGGLGMQFGSQGKAVIVDGPACTEDEQGHSHASTGAKVAMPHRVGRSGKEMDGSSCGVVLLAVGGDVVLDAVHAYEMRSAWED